MGAHAPAMQHTEREREMQCNVRSAPQGVRVCIKCRLCVAPRGVEPRASVLSWKRNRNGTKRNETKRNETKRNETERNGTERNGTKRNETKRNETKRNGTERNGTNCGNSLALNLFV